MNRPRKNDKHLPRNVYFKHGAYYYVKGGKWERIGTELPQALAEYGRRLEAPQGGLPDLVDKVLRVHTQKLAKHTADQYRSAADKIKAAFREFAPDQIKGKHVAALKQSMAETPTMANHTLSFMRTVFTYAVEWQMVESNPCIGVKAYPVKKRSRYLTDFEMLAIHQAAGPKLQVVIELCYLTGQRISDVLALHMRDITADGLYFKASKTKDSTQVQFVVLWDDELRAAVERAKALHQGVVPMTLLASRSRKLPRYRSIVGSWWNACQDAGVEDANLHDLRAKSLTDAKRQGHDATALAGHADAKMTDRYIRLRDVPMVAGPGFKKTA